MAESFAERRRRELGLTGGTAVQEAVPQSSSSDFISRRKAELGLTEPIQQEEVTKPSAKPFTQPTIDLHNGMLPFSASTTDFRDSPIMQQASQMPIEQAEPERPGRDIPVIGHGLKALDWVGEAVEPVANVMRSLYTPGGGLAPVQAMYGAMGGLLGKVAPKLGGSLSGRVAQEAIKEAGAGIPLSAGQALTNQTTDLEEVAKQGLIGGGLGAVTGGAAPLVGAGVKRLLAKPQALPSYEGVSLTGKIPNSPIKVDSGVPPTAKQPSPSQSSKPLFNVGDEAIPTSADGADLSEARKIIDVQSKDGVNYYRFDGETSYMPDNMVRKADAPKTPNPSKYKPEPPVTPKTDPLRPQLQDEFVPGQSLAPEVADFVPINPTSNQKPMPVSKYADERANVAQPVTGQRGIRANYETQLRNENLSDDLRQGINNTDQTYEIKTNQSSIDAADEALKDMSQATSKFLNNEAGGPEHIATGYKLMMRLDQLGKHEEALAISRKLAADLTKGGQTTQAATIISRLSAEGQLLNLIRKAEANGKVVTVKDSIKFKELAAKVQEKAGVGLKENEFNGILSRMEKGENVSVSDINKLSDFLSDAKPTKPKTTNVSDDLPQELKDVKKRDKIISYLDEAEKAALARIAARKSKISSMVLPNIAEWSDHAIVVSAQIAKGTIKAATHVEDLVKLFGEEIRPVASQVFQKAQGLAKNVSRSVGRDDIERAETILNRATGKKDAQKAVVEETANHVKKLIADAKAGTLDPADIQTLRDYSDEIAEMIKGDKVRAIQTQEEKFLQSVKALAKKIAEVETEKIPTDQANREVSSLLRQVVKIADEGTPKLKAEPIDNQALSDIAHDVMEKSRPTPEPKTLQEKIVEKYLKQNPSVSQKDIESLRKLAKNVTKAAGADKIDADIAMQRILNSYEKSSVWDKVQSIRYIGMLLNTHTQAINALSGPIMATTGTVADIFGTMLDIAMHHTLKTPRSTTLYGTNPLRFIGGYVKHLKTGSKAGWHGVNPAGIQSTNEIRGLAFPNLKNPLTFVPSIAERTLGAVAKGADYATYRTVYDSEIAKQGFLDAKNKGIKGKDNIKKHVQDFVNDPSEAAILQADRIGKNTTFQRSDTTGGKVANFLNSAPTLVKPGVNAIFPFVRTPINIASTAVTMTPAGIIKGLIQMTSKSDASRREAVRTLAMGVTGTGIGAVGFHLFDIGIITGANDSGDKNVDNIREQAGQGKYRFNTSALQRYLGAIVNGEGSEAAEKKAKYQKGDEQFDYNKLQPLALPLAAGASLAENKDKKLVSQLAKSGEDSFGSLFGMSTLKGVQSVFQPSYGGTQGDKSLGVVERVAESFMKSFSWGGLAQEARRQDPTQRKTPFNDGIAANTKEYFKSRTPGLSQDLPARKTTLGQDYKNAPGVKGAYLNPYRSEVAPYNEAAQIIAGLIERTGDMKLAPTPPEKSVTGSVKGERVTVKIPTKRYETLQEDIGDEIVKRILALKGYSDDKLAVRIEDIYTDVRKKKMDQVKRELGVR